MILEDFMNNSKQPRVLFITGAGISVDSGVPTFRTGEGLWLKYPVEKVCDITNFEKNYDLSHDFYNICRDFLKDKKPNQAHDFITAMQQKYGEDRVAVATTNVDMLHEMAGSKNVLHLHGKITEMIINWKKHNEQCLDIGYKNWDTNCITEKSKPNVVFFNEATYYEGDVKKNIYMDLSWVVSTLTPQDIIFIVGSSNQVFNINYFYPKVLAEAYNVNPIPYEDSDDTFKLEINKGSTEAIPDMLKIIESKMS